MTFKPPDSFARQIVRWQKRYGRNSLPWQNTRDPYLVWLSEIMLQQTQVRTVLDYYARFLQRFPTVADLAAAPQDDVLALWSGLGYYSRARNLHRCARAVVDLHGGHFPRSAEALQNLPGIGPSTAAAVASFCFSERVAIFDGNVKRVLSRVFAYAGDLACSKSERQLWTIANDLLPSKNLASTMPRYSQGVMDLGATVCSTRKPQCSICPVHSMCQAFADGKPENYPVKTKKLKRGRQHMSLLWAQRPDGAVWLERRPESGIWGGLYCLPVFPTEAALLAFLPKPSQGRLQALLPIKHVLTHKDLYLRPVIAGFTARQRMPVTLAEDAAEGHWFLPGAWPALGLPAPIRKLLESHASGCGVSVQRQVRGGA